MDGYRFIHTLTLENFLSYGEEPVRLDLQPLNVIIGPNASGKSNLLEVLNLLRFLPKDLSVPIREGGGVQEWIWKGGEKSQKQPALEVHLSYAQQPIPLRYRLQFAEVGQRLEL
ncbi:MAG: AAA family ATPase, partial [Prochlorothrix sp.]|nr:AAA family ATPase [Prochlorothrix sp.]